MAQARRERGMRRQMKGWKMLRERMRTRVSRVRWWCHEGSEIGGIVGGVFCESGWEMVRQSGTKVEGEV